MSGNSHIPSVKCLKVILELYLYCLLPSQQMTLEFYQWIKISIRVKTNHLFSLLDSFILYKVILLLSRLDLEERSKNKRLNLISKSSMSQLLLEGAKFKTPQDCLWHLLSHAKASTDMQSITEDTSASPLALCKCLASQRQFRSHPVQPGQTYRPSTGPQSLIYLQLYWKEKSEDISTTATTAKPVCHSQRCRPLSTYAPGSKKAPRNSPHDTEAQTRQSAVSKRKIYSTSFTQRNTPKRKITIQ